MTAERITAIGLMSGTSIDGIDAAVIRTDGLDHVETGPWLTEPYDEPFRDRPRACLGKAGAPADLEAELTDRHAAVVRRLMAEAGLAPRDVAVIGFHGQTILHDPARRLTVQIGDGPRLAADLGMPVVNSFRQADVTAGGQGAPLASLYHRALASAFRSAVAVLNLGGVGNVTWLCPGREPIAFDTGPANAMVDDWVRRTAGLPYDRDGALAASGRVDAAALARLMDHPYFDVPPPKSLDREAFEPSPVAGLSPADGAATLTAFTVATVAAARAHMPEMPGSWLVTGGGRHNRTIMRGLADHLGVPVEPVEAVGWQGDALEAQAFAYLAVRSLRGLPLTVPGTTGVPRPLTGGVVHDPAAQDRGAA